MSIIASLILPLLAISPASAPIPQSIQRCPATFEGALQFEALPDGRHLKLLKPYAFVSDDCVMWAVPAGAIVDGASIPRYLWTIIGGPLEGKYRNASVIHDWYCDRRTQSWRSVHRMFFQAMIAAGVSELLAKTMYMAVYLQGPRWDETTRWNNQYATGDNSNIPYWLKDAMSVYGYKHRNPYVTGANLARTTMTIEERNSSILPVLIDKIETEHSSLDAIDRMVDGIRSRDDFRNQSTNPMESLLDRP